MSDLREVSAKVVTALTIKSATQSVNNMVLREEVRRLNNALARKNRQLVSYRAKLKELRDNPAYLVVGQIPNGTGGQY